MASLLPPVTECCASQCQQSIIIPFAGSGGVPIFDTVAQAQAYPFSGEQLIYLKGFYAAGDLNGGMWIYDPSSGATVNGYDCVALTNVSGRLLRQP